MLRSLRRKILALYLVLVAILLGVGVWAVFNFSSLSGMFRSVTERNYRSTLAAEYMVAALERQDSAELLFLLGEAGRAQDVFLTGQADYLIWFARAEDNITEKDEGQIIASIRESYEQYLALWDRMRAEDAATAHSTYVEEAMPQFLVLRGLCQELLRVNHEALVLGNSQSSEAARVATWSTLGITVAAAVVAFLLAWGLSDSITRPTVRLTESLRHVGQGASREPLPVTSQDEIGELTGEFNALLARLKVYEESNLGQLMAERQKSEAILMAIRDPIIVLDQEMRVAMANLAAQEALAIREGLALGRRLEKATGNQELIALARAGLEGKSVGGGDERPTLALTVHGEDRFYSVETVPLLAPAEVSAGLVMVLKDVTWFKQADRLKREFVSMVSHEFRTPLTSIAMGVGLLKESEAIPAGSREAELLVVVSEESDRLTRLVNELLDLSRMEAGRLEMTMATVDTALLLERAASPFKPQAEEKGVELHVDTGEGAPLVTADGDKITWVLTNLVSNALRYTPKGGSVTLSVVPRGEVAILAVKDTGIGIPREMQSRVFEKFFQVPGRPGGGAGLGLAISREIVRAHGGRIWVESPPGEGSRFMFTLPLARSTGAVSDHT